MPENGRGKGDFSVIHTLDDWVLIWLREVLPNVVKESTIQMYADTMGHHILPVLGKQRLKDINVQAIREWVSQLQNTQIPGTQNGCMTEGTVRNTLSVLSGCMRDAQKYGLIKKNPCVELAWPTRSKNVGESRDWLNEEQIRQLEPLLAAYQDEGGYPIGLGFQMVLYTGITLSEAVALRWADVDFKEEKFFIRYFAVLKREQNGEKKERRYELEKLSGRKKREVPVPDFLMRRLFQVYREYGGAPEDFVLNPSNQEPVQIDRLRAALLRKGNSCGIEKVTPRMLRDTYAMRAVKAGATSDTIAELLGFASSQQVIRRYMPRAVTDKRELIKKMFSET